MIKPVLSIIIVTYNSSDVITDCLSSLPWSSISIETIIIDNNSSDKTRQFIKKFLSDNPSNRIILIQKPINTGYAAGVNFGLEQAQGRYIMLLGPDTRLKENSAATLIKTLEERSDAGIAAPRLLDMDGAIHNSVRAFPEFKDLIFEMSGLPRLFPAILSAPWKLTDFNYNVMSEIDQPEASCVLSRQEAVNQVGLMDERFTMFFNDVDWCRRFRQEGWKILFQPDAEAIHLKGSSVYSNRIPMIWKSHQGFYRYLQKYSSSFLEHTLLFFCRLFLLVTAILRSVFWMTAKLFNKKTNLV